MILKGYIKELPSVNDNIFRVRVPFLEDNTEQEMVFKALLCNQPGIYYGYNVGDCVFISFENDKLDTAIILGKLFVDVDETSSVYQVVNDLSVTSNISLPGTTKLGDYTANDIFKLYQRVSNISDNNLNYIVLGQF